MARHPLDTLSVHAPLPHAQKIACAFCAELPPLNGEQPQDVCDANEAMQAAFIACGEVDPAEDPIAAAPLWNAAWHLATAAGFDAGKIS